MADSDAFGGSGGLIAVDPVTGGQTPVSQGGLFVEPSCVAFASDGSILVSDTAAFGGGGGLIAVDPDNGRQSKLVASDVFSRPFGIAVESGGHIVVAYMQRVHGLGEVMRIDPTTGEHRLVSPHSGVVMPVGVAPDAAGNVFVTDPDEAQPGSRLLRLDSAAATVLSINVPPGAFYSGITLDPSGNILVTNSTTHAPPQVLRFTSTGTLQTVVSEAHNIVFPIAVALLANTAILVLDRHKGIIRVDPLTGEQLLFATGDRFVAPTGIALAP